MFQPLELRRFKYLFCFNLSTFDHHVIPDPLLSRDRYVYEDEWDDDPIPIEDRNCLLTNEDYTVEEAWENWIENAFDNA